MKRESSDHGEWCEFIPMIVVLLWLNMLVQLLMYMDLHR